MWPEAEIPQVIHYLLLEMRGYVWDQKEAANWCGTETSKDEASAGN